MIGPEERDAAGTIKRQLAVAGCSNPAVSHTVCRDSHNTEETKIKDMDCLNVAKILPNSPRKTTGQIQVRDRFTFVTFLLWICKCKY